MLKKYQLFLFLILTISIPFFRSHAAMEIGGEYNYSKKVFALNRTGAVVGRGTGGTLAFYLFNFFAVEANYNKSLQETTDSPNIAISGSTLTLKSYNNTVEVESWGLGLRFSLAARKAMIRPDISLGYAHQSILDRQIYIYDDSASTNDLSSSSRSKIKQDSVFASFALNFRLTQRLKLKASMKTIFKAFEFDQAKDYLKYSIGFTWLL